MSGINDMVRSNRYNLSQLRRKGMYSSGIFSQEKNYRKINVEDKIQLSEEEIKILELKAKKSNTRLKVFNRFVTLIGLTFTFILTGYLFYCFIN